MFDLQKKWLPGQVTGISYDDASKCEWLKVRYDTMKGYAMSNEVQRNSPDIRSNAWHDLAMPHCGAVVRDIPLSVSFRQAFVDKKEYRLIELKDKEGMAVLEIEGSLTMEVPVGKTIKELRNLKNCERVMATVLSGPRWTKDGVEMVQCVFAARAV